MSALLAVGLVALLAASGSARVSPARLRPGDRGSRSVFLDERSRSRIQAVANQSYTRSAVMSPAEVSRKALSELRGVGGGHGPSEAVTALRAITSGHKKILWIDLVKINDKQKGRGLGSAAARRMEAWAQAQGATLALAVSYDYTDAGSPLPFWEKLGYASLYEEDNVPGQPAIIFKELSNG